MKAMESDPGLLTEMQRSLPLDAFADVVVQLQTVETPRARGLRAVYGGAAVAAEDSRSRH